MHSLFSDGAETAEQMVVTAIDKGLKQISFTDHMPLPFETPYCLDIDRLEEYRQTVKDLSKQYAGILSIRLGLEMEYIPDNEHWIKNISDMEWDHLTISIHTLMKDGLPLLVNGTRKEFDNLLFQGYGGNIRKLCTAYYDMLQTACQTDWFDIVGHLDVVKKFNNGQRLFDETDRWYRPMVLKTLDIIAEQKMKLEINTAGIDHPVGQVYPSPWIIREAGKRNIQLVLGSDAHSAKNLGQFFNQVLHKLLH